jgi:hypothetical protein
VGRTKAYELVHAGQWPTRILWLGSLIRVPTAELLTLLGIEPDTDTDTDAGQTGVA